MTTKDEAQPVTTRVSRQEELLFGHYAPLIRRAGNVAAEAESMRAELERLLAECREADAVTVKNDDGLIDGHGVSETTTWLEGLYERAWATAGACYAFHLAAAQDCLDRWAKFREGIDSQPTPADPPGPAVE